MGPTDPILLHLASAARVRPCHVFTLHETMREQKTSFNASAFAAFNQLDISHVLRMLTVFTEEGIEPFKERAKREPVERGSRLPADFIVPVEWRLWAQTQRKWPMDVVDTTAAEFVDFWCAKSGKDAAKLDWERTWRNWVRGSRRADGQWVPESAERAFADQSAWKAFCRSELERASQRGDRFAVLAWRRKLDSIAAS